MCTFKRTHNPEWLSMFSIDGKYGEFNATCKEMYVLDMILEMDVILKMPTLTKTSINQTTVCLLIYFSKWHTNYFY